MVYDFGKPVSPAHVGINPRTSEVEFLDADGKQMRPVKVYSETTYQRDRNTKTVTRLHLDPSGPLNARLEANLAGFRRLYVADTTPLPHGDGFSAFTAVGVLKTQRISDEMSAVSFEMAALFEFHELRGINPELAGWATVVDLVRKAPDYDPSWFVGLIGDSELNQLSDYNERRTPIAGTVLLPHNFRMHYAGDASADGVLNQAIKKCDVLSRQAVERLLRESPPPIHGRVPSPGVPCKWWRLWRRLPDQPMALFEIVETSAVVDSYFTIRKSPLLSSGRIGSRTR